MLVLKRLAVVAVTMLAIVASEGAALAGLRTALAMADRAAAISLARHGEHRLVS